MQALLSISRAAQLLGATRASLQNRIREGALPAFDGQVTLDDLRQSLRDFPLQPVVTGLLHS